MDVQTDGTETKDSVFTEKEWGEDRKRRWGSSQPPPFEKLSVLTTDIWLAQFRRLSSPLVSEFKSSFPSVSNGTGVEGLGTPLHFEPPTKPRRPRRRSRLWHSWVLWKVPVLKCAPEETSTDSNRKDTPLDPRPRHLSDFRETTVLVY